MMEIKIEKTQVLPVTRQLKATWTVEESPWKDFFIEEGSIAGTRSLPKYDLTGNDSHE